MKVWLMRVVAVGLLIAVGIALGAWVTTRHFRPMLDAEQDLVASCKAARDNLAGLATEQGKALSDLILAEKERQVRAEQAVTEAKASADAEYAAANRLQQERTGGDQCEAATSIIDKEFGL